MKTKYSTKNVSGLDYRSIAELMTNNGDKMEHSTVRNIINRSMEKFAKELIIMNDINATQQEIINLATDSKFQKNIENIIADIYNDVR